MRTSFTLVRLTVLISLFTIFSSRSYSQSISTPNGKFEFGLGVGPMFFLGDLGGTAGVGATFVKDLNLPLTKFCKGIYLEYYPKEWAGIRVAGNLGYVEGDDAQAPSKGGDEEDRKYRNLSFKSNINELYGALEIYPTVFFERYDGLKGKLRPYLLGGAGMYHFNPKTKDVNGKWVALAPLHLEGQGFTEYPDSKPYKLFQKNLLFGFGFKYYLKENMYVGLEILHRKLFTDYVDDVSHSYYIDQIAFDKYLTPANAAIARRLYYRATYGSNTRPQGTPATAQRGDPKLNDAYFSSILRFGWRIGGIDARSKQLKCPVFY
jgi:hypothetical protein